jgi:hypothetical protein
MENTLPSLKVMTIVRVPILAMKRRPALPHAHNHYTSTHAGNDLTPSPVLQAHSHHAVTHVARINTIVCLTHTGTSQVPTLAMCSHPAICQTHHPCRVAPSLKPTTVTQD